MWVWYKPVMDNNFTPVIDNNFTPVIVYTSDCSTFFNMCDRVIHYNRMPNIWHRRYAWGFFRFFFFSVRLLSVLRGYSCFFQSPPQWPMTPDFVGFSIPDFIHYIYFPILILEKEPVFPFSMLSAKQGNYWYHFYNVFGMTRSLTEEWTGDLPHSMPALYH